MLENVFRVVVGIDFPTEYILNNSMVIYIYIYFFIYIPFPRAEHFSSF